MRELGHPGIVPELFILPEGHIEDREATAEVLAGKIAVRAGDRESGL